MSVKTSQQARAEAEATAKNSEYFVPSSEWQDIPDWAVMPNGGEFRTDFQTGKCQARWDGPVPDPEKVIDNRTGKPQKRSPESSNGAAPKRGEFSLLQEETHRPAISSAAFAGMISL
jgi:hypothetical protein